MKAPKGFEIVPIEYRKTRPYPRKCKTKWWDKYGKLWLITKDEYLWDDPDFEWAIESSAAIKPPKDYSETVLRRIEKELRGHDDKPFACVSVHWLRHKMTAIRSDIKKMKGEQNAV